MRISGLRRSRPSDEVYSGPWIKSSYSGYSGECVEISAGDMIRVRDSKHTRGAILSFTQAEWNAFVSGVRNGEFGRNS
ncbi:DUF397 domain-containing protein [Trebonia kvetii]|uniref:DUF397 domain-containing protein n=1 Tax=Trebonia kvetii TaxID=2480626 RepID=A0A6P2C194_9ACTN|nr:DUF397 domain-containing protein [Trebonia kvetii]TVZ04707.1 DUF397 domain-containing protein [Trebonia kvetii]